MTLLYLKVILKLYQSKTLRIIAGDPWYISNFEIHKGLNEPYVRDELSKACRRHIERLSNHENLLAINSLHTIWMLNA